MKSENKTKRNLEESKEDHELKIKKRVVKRVWVRECKRLPIRFLKNIRTKKKTFISNKCYWIFIQKLQKIEEQHKKKRYWWKQKKGNNFT